MTRKYQSHRLFFPAALVLAAALAPLKAAEMAGFGAPGLPPFWHGHEMLFGFAYAVIGGYLLTARRRAVVLTSFSAWLAGRLAILAPDLPQVLEIAAALAFPVLLSLLAGRPFARSAKTPRNFAFVGIIGAFSVAEIVYQLGAAGVLADGRRIGLGLAIDLIVLLLFTMGGRIIAAASSGAHQAKGRKLAGAAQPGLEQVGLLLLVAMLVLDAAAVSSRLSGAFALAAGLTVLLRLARWQVWRLLRIREVVFLHLGYLWLAVGLLAKGAAQIIAERLLYDALHILLIGGLGTLALTMIMRSTLQRARKRIVLPGIAGPAAMLLSAAAMTRGVAVAADAGLGMLWLSGVLWTGACLLVLAWLASFLARPE